MQRAPFLAAGRELAIDLDSPRINPPTEGRALFAETGEPTAYLESIFNAMRELTPGIERTKIFVDTLIDLRLVEPVDIKLGFDDGVNLELTGLYTINKSALHDLPDQKVVELFRRGYLNLIYLMIASISHVHSLAQKRNDRLLDATSSLT